MPAVPAPAPPSSPSVALRHRVSADGLTAAQLTALRNAVGKMQGIQDNRGFAALAGIHGWPQYRCKHSTETTQARLFLPWHRAYLYEFELALQEQDRDARLPWWDWPASRQTGIPAAYADLEAEGRPNPLAGSALPSDVPNPPPDWTATTHRTPGPLSDLPDAKIIEEVTGQADYYDFELALETQLHNLIHGWVGGSMSEINTAAYDPLFWAHHTMVDRIWSIWQSVHASPGPPPSTYGTALGFGQLTVGAVVDTAKLGYDYAASVQHVAVVTEN